MNARTNSRRTFAVPLVANGAAFVVAPDWTDDELGIEVSPPFNRLLEESYTAEPSLVDMSGRLIEAVVHRPAWDGGHAYLLIDEFGTPLEAIAMPRPRIAEADWSGYLTMLSQMVRFSDALPAGRQVALDGAFISPNFLLLAHWRENKRALAASERVTTWATIKTYSKLVLLGEAGTGKTSCLKRIAWEMLSDAEDTVIPVFVSGREFNDLNLATLSSNLATYGLRLNADDLDRLFAAGTMALIVDGLDEATDNDRSRLVSGLIDLADRYPLMRIVASTRPSTYGWELESFVHAAVAPFSDQQINEWLWLHHADVRICREVEIALESDPELRELARTPLLLAIASTALERLSVVPRGRAGLYGALLRVTLSEWDESRGVSRRWRGLSLDEAFQALGTVAWGCARSGRSTFAISDVALWLRESSFQLEDQQVDQFVRSTGVLSPTASEEWHFEHRAMLDFLVADRLVRSSESIIDFFQAEISRSEWHERWLLACELTSDPAPLLRVVHKAPTLRPGRRAGLLLTALSRQPRMNPLDRTELMDTAIAYLNQLVDGLAVSEARPTISSHSWTMAVDVLSKDKRVEHEYVDCVKAIWASRRQSESNELADRLRAATNPVIRDLADLLLTNADEPYQLIVHEYATTILFLLTDDSPFRTAASSAPRARTATELD